MDIKPSIMVACLSMMAFAGGAGPCRAAETGGLPSYLADRGDGIPASLLGTYIREKEFIVYPFYEYTRIGKFQYGPHELGVPVAGKPEFLGKLVERETLLFLAYGLSDSLAIEFESALHGSVNFTKAPDDNTGTPATVRESGFGDTETNIRWRYWKETATRPELTWFFKTVFPLQRNKKLLGEQHWDFEPGLVLTKGYPFGTLSFKLAAAWDTGERKAQFSEWSVDYLKRINSKWRVAFSLEAAQLDELSLIGELQYTLGKNAVLKLNSGFGLSPKAPDFAPEIGVLFRF